ncbi:hypothetical protein GJAV_G00142170 [Gymnothorax javanicus]|nr:hypothetical protein GJAV_G00142170 [Gymnothorax javanicus]
MKVVYGDPCLFLSSLQQTVLSTGGSVELPREVSLLNLMHESELRLVKFLPDIVALQRDLVKSFQNRTDQAYGTIAEFIQTQRPATQETWEKRIRTFLTVWNQLRLSLATNGEIKIPAELCQEDLDLSSELQVLLPRRQGIGLCSTALVGYLISLQNQLVYASDKHMGEENGYRVSVTDLTELHVVGYEPERDLIPLVLSNCQYSLECGRETVSQYDLPKIQQLILSRILQGKPSIAPIGIPALISRRDRDYERVFSDVKAKVGQEPHASLKVVSLVGELPAYSDVCEALGLVELTLDFLCAAGGDANMELVPYLRDVLRMERVTPHVLKVSSAYFHPAHLGTTRGVTPEELRPYPKAPARKRAQKRRTLSSSILTDTPVKQQMEQEKAERAQKKKKFPYPKATTSRKQQKAKKKREKESSSDEEESFCAVCVEPFSNSCSKETDFDDGSRSAGVLASAKYSAINEINKVGEEMTGRVYVYFITKLPRVEGGTSFVGFHGGNWSSVHIDDLRRSKDIVSDIKALKSVSISQIFLDQADPTEAMEVEGAGPEQVEGVLSEVLNTTALLRSCVQSAVSMLRDQAGGGTRCTRRVEILLTLLEDSEETNAMFLQIVKQRLHALLVAQDGHALSPKNWVFREASDVAALQEGGTFKHTLWKRVQSAVTPILARLVSVLDRDRNLDLLLDRNCGEAVRKLWLDMFADESLIDIPYTGPNHGIEPQNLLVLSQIGVGWGVGCALPFSWRVREHLEEVRAQIEHRNGEGQTLTLYTLNITG